MGADARLDRAARRRPLGIAPWTPATVRTALWLALAWLAPGVALSQGPTGGSDPGDKSQGEEEQIRRRREWFLLSRGLETVERADLLRAEAVMDLDRAQRAAPARAGETWTSLGPLSMTMLNWTMGRVTGRVAALAVHPDSDDVLYLGGATGGVWKTTNGGASWTPVFDSAGTLTVGSLAVDRQSGVVWVGTGERSYCAAYFGLGLYRSTDAGATFQPRNGSGTTALRLSYIVSIALHPASPQTLLVSGDGYCQGGTELTGGVYKTTDAGATWRRVLSGGGSDVVYDPGDPAILYAALSGDGVYRSTNGGESWIRAGSGMPASPGRVRLALAPSRPQTLYALAVTSGGGARLYRTTDGARSWELRNPSACEGQCDYNLSLDVHPASEDTLLVGSIRFSRSTDAGATLTPRTSTWGPSQKVHQDTHVLRYSRRDAQRFWVGSDGGLWRTDSGGSSFVNLNATLNLTQFYDIAVHPHEPGRVFGGAQDNSSLRRGGSQVWAVTEVTGDGFMNLVDPANPSFVVQTSYPRGGLPNLVASTTGGEPNSFTPVSTAGLVPGEPYPWVTPLAILPGTVFAGSHSVYRRPSDHFSAWTKISGNLTGASGWAASVISAAIGSRAAYAGTSNGRIHRTDDVLAPAASVQWLEVTGDFPGGYVSDLAFDPVDPRRVFATRGAFGLSRLYRSTTGGTSWTPVGTGLPNVPANAVALDPLEPYRVYVGTDVGVYESWDGGDTFTPFSTGLPLGLVVTDLEVDDAPHVLVAGTYGRGAYRVNLAGGPVVALDAGALTVGEGAGTAGMDLQVTTPDGAPTPHAVTVTYETEDATALQGSDYTRTSGQLTFPAGSQSGAVRTVIVPLADDGLDEDDETFRFSLTGIASGLLGTSTAVVTLVDDDPLPVVTSADRTLAAEGDSGTTPLGFPLELSAPSGRRVWLAFRTEDGSAQQGRDFQAVNTPHLFEPGQTQLEASVAILGERLHEPGGPERFQVRLEHPVNATVGSPGTWQGTIVDDDPPPALSAEDCTRVEGDQDGTPCSVGVRLSNPSTQPVGVSYATAGQSAAAGADFLGRSGTLDVPPEAVLGTVEVAILGDLEKEPNETFLLNLSGPTGGTIADGEAVGTILDDEAMGFHPIPPCRLLDTRQAGGPLQSGEKRSFPALGASCGSVPAAARALVVNVTTAQATAAGNLRLYPAALPTPSTSVLNFPAGAARANNATVLVGASGRLTVQCDMAGAGSTHVIVDVFGYYE